jgi:hypothetical protein
MEPDGHNFPCQWVRPVTPLKHTTINVRAVGYGLEWPGGGAALEAAAAAAWQWQQQLGGSVACAAVAAAQQRRQWQQWPKMGVTWNLLIAVAYKHLLRMGRRNFSPLS